ncbi:quinolinate phosphoribosyltransferase, isoform CRA_a [Rattus norvegicus]|uniref:Quinolinate phosphoribosyltransferase, isoform CRA_a n=1 Tax=Rattus norvegicus TaxID=10116 RepID=A6I9L6_RAT|nr:quinolinate phosphoribosyltransferase, isoform CRA_a [Rattus norvegicus]
MDPEEHPVLKALVHCCLTHVTDTQSDV